ncbi:MAG: YbjQ family protein [Candidatus Diapherotrites archaeon]
MNLILTTTDFVPNKKISQVLGIAKGNAIRSRGVGGHFVAGIERMFGGEITAYLATMNEAREEAMQRMTKDAEALGADAVINVRLMTSEIMQNAAEVVAYGTAVKLG